MEKSIPKLRFPEFNEEWLTKEFSDIYSFKPTNSYSRDNLDYENGSIKNIHYGDIHTKFNSLFDIEKETVPFIKKEINITKISDDCYIKEGDLIIADASEDYNDIGKMIEIKNLNNEKVVAGLHTFLARQKTKDTQIGFSSFLMKSWNIRYQIMRIAQGTKVLSLSSKRVGELKLIIPSAREQQKITAFLITVDNHIKLLEKQKEQLALYKKGIMQQLFSQKLRFKDDAGNIFPDWEETTLGEIGRFQTSSVDKLSIEGEKEVYLVNYMNVYRHENINNESKKKLQVVTAKENQIISSNLEKGDILFTPSSETPYDIGHSVVIFEDLEDCVYSYHVMRFRPKRKIDILYSHYFCNVPNVLNQLSKLATGSTRFTISVKSFSSINLKLPCIKEQKKIATFLSAIDVQIEQVSNLIKETKEFKKGLLQQMFV